MKRLRPLKTKLNKEKVCKSAFFMAVICFAASIFAQVVISNKFAIKGSEFMVLKDQKEQLKKENSQLKLAISKESSLAQLEERALNLGFTEYSEEIAVISSPQFAAAQ